MADQEADQPQGQTEQQSDDKDIYKLNVGKLTIPINLGYVKSQTGIVVIVSLVLSFVGFICISATYQKECDIAYGSSYRFLEFVTISWFVITLFRLIIFALSLDGVLCFKVVPWLVVELPLLVVYIFFFLVASSVVAAHACWQDGYKAAAAFGFLCLVALVLDCVITFIRLRREHPPTQNTILIFIGVQHQAPSAAPEYDPESNIENKY